MSAFRQHSVPMHYLLQVLALMPEGRDWQTIVNRLLARGGWPLDTLQQAEHRIPLRWFEILMRLDRHQSALLKAIQLGSQVSLSSQGRLNSLITSLATLRQGLDLLPYSRLITQAAQLSHCETPADTYVLVHPCTGSAVLDQAISGYALAAIARLIQLLASDEIPLEILLKAPPPPDWQSLGSTGISWQFDAPVSTLRIPSAALDTAMRFSDPVAHQLERKTCDQALKELKSRERLDDQVRRLLMAHDGYAPQSDVARALHMSCSTLKRQLAQLAHPYQDILNACRQQRALELLADPRLRIDDIALRLGYSDQSNFSHAFRRWRGVSPGHYRRELQRERGR